MANRTINVDYLARVEGEGAMHVKIHDDKLEEVKLKIFEPPRFFEALLRGRDYTEAPDITARICGICPVAYLMGAVHAMESICEVRVSPQIRELRRLLYCGEWIESHVLHMFMLHAPDFLGYEDAIQLAKDHPDVVKMGLRLKKLGNGLMTVLGGREVHPINVRVGGFYKSPKPSALKNLRGELDWALGAALQTVELVAGFEFQDFEQDYEFVCLRHGEEYPLNEGRLVSNRGLDVPISEYDNVLIEEHVEHSTALHSHRENGDICHVGPLARYAMNYDLLTPAARSAAKKAGLPPIVRNPFRSITVRAVEVVYAIEEAIRIIDSYEVPDKPFEPVTVRAGTGYGCTEAPRGICYHRYTIDDQGIITDAKIVSPTAVNQKIIEKDLWHFVEANLDLPDEKLKWTCEQAIRNYDPCISCSTHFLDLTVERS